MNNTIRAVGPQALGLPGSIPHYSALEKRPKRPPPSYSLSMSGKARSILRWNKPPPTASVDVTPGPASPAATRSNCDGNPARPTPTRDRVHIEKKCATDKQQKHKKTAHRFLAIRGRCVLERGTAP